MIGQSANMRTRKARKAAGVILAAVLAVGSSCSSLAAESAMDVICAPSGIAPGTDGTVLVTDTYHKVIWSVKDKASTVYAGKMGIEDLYGEPIGGYRDGGLTECFFKEPWDIEPFLDGYAISDAENHVVRLIHGDKTQTACGCAKAGFTDGKGVQASFSRPTGLAADGNGTLYIADTDNNAIRTIDSEGTVGTYVRNILEPTGLCFAGGSLYVAESGANRILKITDGVVSVAAGNGEEGKADGAAGQAQFSYPQGVTVSEDGIIYVSDTGNNAVRKIQNGQVTTLISCDPTALDAYPMAPRGLLVQGKNIYICDHFSKKLLVIPR